MKLKSFCLDLDFLGKTQRFTIAKKRSFQTYIGSFFSVGIGVIVIYFTIYFGLQILQRKKPELLHTSTINPNPPKFELTNDNFVFGIALENPDYSVYINESIYHLKVEIHSQVQVGNGLVETTVKEMPLVRCNEYEFKLLPEYFHPLDLENLYCIDNKNAKYEIEGDFGTDVWTYITFSFSRCKNSTQNNNSCMPDDEITHRLDGGYLGIFMTDKTIVATNYKQPAEIYGKNIFSTVSPYYFNEVWCYMKHITVNTDKGLLMDMIYSEEHIAFENLRESIEYKTVETFLNLIFRFSQTVEIYDRSYSRIQEIAADIGGIMKLALFVGDVIVYFFREMLYRDYILGYFFEEKKASSKIQTIDKNALNYKKSKNKSLNSFYNNNSNLNYTGFQGNNNESKIAVSMNNTNNISNNITNSSNVNNIVVFPKKQTKASQSRVQTNSLINNQHKNNNASPLTYDSSLREIGSPSISRGISFIPSKTGDRLHFSNIIGKSTVKHRRSLT